MGHIDQTAGQITGVCGLERRIGQALSGTVGGVEILQNRQAFFKVRDDRGLNDLTRRLGHQAAHTAKLLHLGLRTTGTGVGHHIDGVDFQLAAVGADMNRLQLVHHGVSDPVRRLGPGINDLVVLFALGDQTIGILLLIFLNQGAGLSDQNLLALRNNNIVLTKGNAGLGRFLKAQAHDLVGKDDRRLLTAVAIDRIDQIADFLLGQGLFNQAVTNIDVLRQECGQLHAARRSIDHLAGDLAVRGHFAKARLDLGVQGNNPSIQGRLDLTQISKQLALARFVFLGQGQVIEAQNNILRRHNDRATIGGREDVVGRHHQDAGFELSFQR